MKTLRYLFSLSLFFLMPTLSLAQRATPSRQSNWYGDKYSMFIHYGLYSIPGGVWNGEPVREGYSEQIFTFAIRFSDWYEALTQQFTAKDFDAKKIVSLAEAGGMRSIVLTAKHHDGFCLWKTETTTYNSFDGTPARRDLVKELADECHKRGMRFGLYFSLIDWHYPYAVPFTSHNADPITPPHHEYNKAQVRELLSHYGEVDELWFDMGSQEEEQSRELYQLVHDLQPNCMVSGRVGNDYADFCVMADNEYPDYSMMLPWQTAASMFDETWGYRSWQERGLPTTKVQEKLSSLLSVVALGGKYLLNIGPMSEGAVVPFEQEVIEEMGRFIHSVPQAIYNTVPSPFGIIDHKIVTTLSDNRKELYLFVPNGTETVFLPYVKKGEISRTRLLNGKAKPSLSTTPGGVRLSIPSQQADKNTYQVVQVSFHKALSPVQSTLHPTEAQHLSPYNATPLYAHSSIDYYTGFKSILGYRWTLPSSHSQSGKLYFSDREVGQEVVLSVGNQKQTLKLTPRETQKATNHPERLIWQELKYRKHGGHFGYLSPELITPTPTDEKLTTLPVNLQWQGAGTAHYLYYQLECTETDIYPIDFLYREGIMVFLDGEYIAGEIARTSPQESNHRLQLLLPFTKGQHQLTIKIYNRWGKQGYLNIIPQKEYNSYSLPLTLPFNSFSRTLSIHKPLTPPAARPASLYNIRWEAR